MKSTMWRLLLTLLLAVSLPLQGYAAHALQDCGMGAAAVLASESAPHHGSGDVSAHGQHQADPHQGSAMKHGTMTGDGSADHRGACATLSAEQGNLAMDCHAQDSGAASEHASCSVCAACCHALALITQVPHFHLPAQRPLAVATVPSDHEGLHSGGLERPPRSLQH